MNIRRYPMPQSREPFINTNLIPAGLDPETGGERWWISSWNANTGSTGVLVTASGKNRVYRFERGFGLAGCGAYSAAYAGDDKLWLVSDTAALRRLDLRTGAVGEFRTGAASGLVFAGMPYDPETGKFLFFANTNHWLTGVCYDTKACKTHKLYDETGASTLSQAGFPNGDGTYTLNFNTSDPDIWQLRRWDPKTDELVPVLNVPSSVKLFHSVSSEKGHYLTGLGWFDGRTLSPGPMPEKEADWFGLRGGAAYGFDRSSGWICRWTLDTGKVENICRAPDVISAVLTENAEILSFSLFGMLQVFDLTGNLLLSRRLETDSWGALDCLAAGDGGVIIGTPFITQRFWVFDEKTGTGYDAGMASPGVGEVLRTWYKRGKFFMASYTESVLTEYDPSRHAGFPDNPRVVARPANSMRPVADAEDDRFLYYASNHHYGHLGCTLTRYDLDTGRAFYADDPVPAHSIVSLLRTAGALWGGCTWHSDCRCTPEPEHDAFAVRIDPDTLRVTDKYPAPEDVTHVLLCGETDGGLLTILRGESSRFALFDTSAGTFRDIGPLPDGQKKLLPTGRQDEYIVLRGNTAERWRIAAQGTARLDTLLTEDGIRSIFLSRTADGPVLLASLQKEFLVIRDFLP